MKDKIAKLFTVKSIVTLAMTALMIVLALRGNIDRDVLTIYTTIIAFYFGTQAEKKTQKTAAQTAEESKEE